MRPGSRFPERAQTSLSFQPQIALLAGTAIRCVSSLPMGPGNTFNGGRRRLASPSSERFFNAYLREIRGRRVSSGQVPTTACFARQDVRLRLNNALPSLRTGEFAHVQGAYILEIETAALRQSFGGRRTRRQPEGVKLTVMRLPCGAQDLLCYRIVNEGCTRVSHTLRARVSR